MSDSVSDARRLLLRSKLSPIRPINIKENVQ